MKITKIETISPDLARDTVRSSLWSYAARYSGKLMVFISTIILARLLTKDDFGVAGYALVVLSFLEVLQGLGVGQAIIYFPDSSETRNSAFWITQGTGLILFFLTWEIAPFASIFFNDPRATYVVRLLAFNFPINAIGNIHDWLLQKDLSFSRRFIPDFVRSTSKGIVSILLAALGMGVNSLIIGHLIGTTLAVIAFWLVMPWRPSFKFGGQQLRPLLSYGVYIILFGILTTVLTESDYLLVGHFMGSISLGVYAMAFRIPDMLIVQFNYTISKVIFPIFTKVRHDEQVLRNTFLMTLRYVTLITVPLGLGTALIARPLVFVFLTEKWIDVYPVLQAISIYALMLSLAHHAGDVYKAQGRPIIDVYISAVRTVVLVPALIWATSIQKSIITVGWVHAALATVTGITSLFIVSRMHKISINAIITAIAPAITSGIFMALVVLIMLLVLENASMIVQLECSIIAGALSYFGILVMLHKDVFNDAGKVLRSVLNSS